MDSLITLGEAMAAWCGLGVVCWLWMLTRIRNLKPGWLLALSICVGLGPISWLFAYEEGYLW